MTPESKTGDFDVRALDGADPVAFDKTVCGALAGVATLATIEAHDQVKYLVEYLRYIHAKALVVEPDYVDADFLADFTSYYVTCFEPVIKRYCKRLHFFSVGYSPDEFRAYIFGRKTKEELEAFKSAYLGFIVVRPLPEALIGRTALVPYPAENRRNFTAIRPYVVHLFGVSLVVNTLAFQEQDSVLAACATVALWSAFQRTADMFGSTAPRPPEITEAAERIIRAQRPLPSKSLIAEQICGAIRSTGLTFEFFDLLKNDVPLLSLLYGYLAAGIPVVLGLDIEGEGGHAVTLTGYSLRDTVISENEGHPFGKPRLPLRGRRIDKFYAHDDGFGPFSRLHFAAGVPGDPDADPPTSDVKSHFIGEWHDDGDPEAKKPLWPLMAVVPLYNKIRLSFLEAVAWPIRFHELATLILPSKTELEWDLALISTSDYKAAIRNATVSDKRKLLLLSANQPRYFWRALLRANNVDVAEVLADATSFVRAFPIFRVNFFDAGMAERAASLLGAGFGGPVLTEEFRLFIISEIADH